MNPAHAMAIRALPYLPWRRPRIESGPVILSARRLYILPTRAGLVFGLLLLGLLVGAINYGVSLAYLFTFWFAGLALVAMPHTQRNLSGLIVRAGSTPPVFAGETAVFRLHLENPGGPHRYGIALQHPLALADTTCDVPANGEAGLALPLPQIRRGWHTPGRFSIHSVHPLGLFRCWSVLELDWGVLVYPAPAADALPFPRTGAGEVATPRAEGAEFNGLRTYRPGDPPRRIAWKAAARSGRDLLTKQFTGSAAGSLWLDWRLAPERDIEARLSRLTRWALDAHAAGLPFGLRLPSQEIAAGSGEAHLRACLEALAREGGA